MDQYHRYHRKPYAKYLDVQSFNKKFGTNLPDVEDYDLYFHYTFTAARKIQGPDDYLQVKFASQDDFKEMKKGGKSWSQWGKDFLKNMPNLGKKHKGGHMGKKMEGKKVKMDVETENVEVEKENVELDDLLSEPEENVVEEEYEEEAATPVPPKNIVSEKSKISELVREASKDTAEFKQDMKHLIQFKSSKLPLEEQLMKGRPKYLKALKAYLKGDKNAEVKMSWKKSGKMVKVADLNPKKDSLKALLRSEAKVGSIRIVECV